MQATAQMASVVSSALPARRRLIRGVIRKAPVNEAKHRETGLMGFVIALTTAGLAFAFCNQLEKAAKR